MMTPTPLRLTHVTSTFEGGYGITTVLDALTERLVGLGHDVSLMALGPPPEAHFQGVETLGFEPDHMGPRLLAKLGRSRALRAALLAHRADVFHAHGLWMMPNVYPAEAARRFYRPLVHSPHGMLGRDALTFSATAKKVFWAVWQRRALAAVSCFHATADSEYDDIRRFGLKQPVAVIPNGIDLPDLGELDAAGADGQRSTADAPYILSLGRLHPKKGLDRLIAAFGQIANAHPDWRLRIVGPDEGGHADQLARQIQTANLQGQISLEPPVFGIEKFRLLQRAQVFALATRHENFAMTVAESLAVETPVISTRGAPWGGLVENDCGWWIDHGPEAMAAALREVIEMPPDARHAMGERGRVWMQRDFGWDGIAMKMSAVYAWLHGQRPQPNCVRT
ncbi:MAG: glycosyltransferase [Pseudomonadota bacterium]